MSWKTVFSDGGLLLWRGSCPGLDLGASVQRTVFQGASVRGVMSVLLTAGDRSPGGNQILAFKSDIWRRQFK